MCSPEAHAFNSTGDALSTWWVKLKSLKLALPSPPPPPWAMVPLCCTPQDHESTSTSSLCLLSRDSPLMSPSFAKMSDAITSSYPIGAFVTDLPGSTGLGRWQLGNEPERHGQPL